MASNSTALTYSGGQDRPPSLSGDTEFASEAGAPGGLFHADYKRHDDLKQMLDSNKDSLKLEAMKRIIGVRPTPFTRPETATHVRFRVSKKQSDAHTLCFVCRRFFRWWPEAVTPQTCSLRW